MVEGPLRFFGPAIKGIVGPVFAIVVLIPLGSLFQKDYRFLGEDWLTEARREDEHLIAAKNCFITAAMYGGFLGLSVMCCMNNKRRGRM